MLAISRIRTTGYHLRSQASAGLQIASTFAADSFAGGAGQVRPGQKVVEVYVINSSAATYTAANKIAIHIGEEPICQTAPFRRKIFDMGPIPAASLLSH